MIEPRSPSESTPSKPAPGTALPPPLPPSAVPPQLPPPLPAGSARSSRRASWKWIVPVGIGGAGLSIFLSQCVFVRAEGTTTRPGRSEPGITHFNERIGRVPWSIHVVKVDRSEKDLTFMAGLAAGRVLGVNRISEMARAVPPELGKAVAVVNGDFYERDNRTYAGDPRGLQIVNGELVSGTSTATVWWDVEGNPQVDNFKGRFAVTWPDGRKTSFGLNQQRRSNMAVLYTSTYGDSTRVSGGRDLVLEREGNGPWLPLRAGETYRARVREVVTSSNTRLTDGVMVLSLGAQALMNVPETPPGTVIEISTATTPDLKGVQTAISGGPILIKDGKSFSETEPPPGTSGAYSERSKYERHPRSAVAWNATNVFLITVDGRQPGLSVGMTLAELAKYMVKLGCTDGMNFDGGASASLWMAGEIINDPCQGERAVANGLIVVRKKK